MRFSKKSAATKLFDAVLRRCADPTKVTDERMYQYFRAYCKAQGYTNIMFPLCCAMDVPRWVFTQLEEWGIVTIWRPDYMVQTYRGIAFDKAA